MTLTEELKRAGRSAARERILKALGALPPGSDLLAQSIGQRAQVPLRCEDPANERVAQQRSALSGRIPRSGEG
jgi:hypothetical protein